MSVSGSRRGTLYVFLAAVLCALGGLCIKAIPWNGMSINGGRTIIAAGVIGLYLAWRGHRLRLNRWVFLGALCVFGTNALFAVANKLTTAANTIVLQFTAPIFVIWFSILFFRQKPGKLDLAACACVLGGGSLLLRGQPVRRGRPGQRAGPAVRDGLRGGGSAQRSP